MLLHLSGSWLAARENQSLLFRVRMMHSLTIRIGASKMTGTNTQFTGTLRMLGISNSSKSKMLITISTISSLLRTVHSALSSRRTGADPGEKTK